MDYRVKIKEERNGILGFYGTGNVSGLFEISDEQLVNTKIDMSLFDTNKAIKDKNKKKKLKKLRNQKLILLLWEEVQNFRFRDFLMFLILYYLVI
ncbi:hypothetical protein D9C22_21120 [Bacillus sp. WR11]|nr:hypothetical protein D9C22_21120 [Bacillus sp. WR11]